MEQETVNTISTIIIPKKWISWFDDTRDSLLKDLEDITPEQIEAVEIEIWEAEKAEEVDAQKQYEIENNSLKDYQNKFLYVMDWVPNKSSMVSHFNKLLKTNALKINTDKMWRHIDLDCLDYEIRVLNLWNWNYDNPDYNVKMRNSSNTDFINKCTFETNLDGLYKILETNQNWWIIPDENDIKWILKKLKAQYPDIISNSNKTSTSHDEDIAFFMLLTQCYWEFLLRDVKALKCYDKFRWIKMLKENGTGQVMLFRKRK